MLLGSFHSTLTEHLLDFFEEGCFLGWGWFEGWVVFKFLDGFLVVGGEFLGDVDIDSYEEVATDGAVEFGESFAFEA